jgi:hypothetical protein
MWQVIVLCQCLGSVGAAQQSGISVNVNHLHTALLIVHIAAGAVGLVLAWPVLFARKRRGPHTVMGRAYAAAAAALCLTAFGLWAYDPLDLLGLGILALLTAVWAGGGVWFARARPRIRGGWRTWHLNFMCSSVIAFVTAFVVQLTDGHLLAWILPTIVGSPLISRRTAVEQGRARPLRIALPRRAAR